MQKSKKNKKHHKVTEGVDNGPSLLVSTEEASPESEHTPSPMENNVGENAMKSNEVKGVVITLCTLL